MDVLLIQVDGKLPNVALMRIAAHHRQIGDTVSLKRGCVHRELGEYFDIVYASAIFEKSRPKVEVLMLEYPGAIVGGTGVDVSLSLESIGISTTVQDYSVYPEFRQSVGFTQRGCRLRCPFCVVPKKEGANREELTISELWRGERYPREILLLDNDFFGQPNWRDRIAEIHDGGFKVCFTQGINVRLIGDEEAAAIASVDYRDDSMKVKRVYCAWDSRRDETRVISGLERLAAAGVKPDHIMVYVLIGYWHEALHDDDFYRVHRLLEFGARAYPMPYRRTKELVGFQRWVVGAYAKAIPWADWVAARYEPRNLRTRAGPETPAERFPLFHTPK